MKSWLAKIAILTLFTFIPFGINAQQKAGGDTTATATQADAAADSLTDAMAADSMDDAALADGQDLHPMLWLPLPGEAHAAAYPSRYD